MTDITIGDVLKEIERRLEAVAQQAPPQTERTKIRVTIFNERGQKLQQIEDGEVIEGEVLEPEDGAR